MMKVLLLGMMMAVAGGENVAAMSGDSATLVFAWCIGGGFFGMIAGLCCTPFNPKNIGGMAQEICGNLALAIIFGPSATFWVAARMDATPNIYWFTTVSAALGIVGLAIVRTGKSEFVSMILERMGVKKPSTDPTLPPSGH